MCPALDARILIVAASVLGSSVAGAQSFTREKRERVRRAGDERHGGLGDLGRRHVRGVPVAGRGIVPGTPPLVYQIYAKDVATGATSLVSVNVVGQPANSTCARPHVSSDGRFAISTARRRTWFRATRTA
jgi:hypothetical protein